VTVSSCLEAPAFISGFDDIAVVGQPIEQRGRHLGVADREAWLKAWKRELEL
jgi:hypothetical protein